MDSFIRKAEAGRSANVKQTKGHLINVRCKFYDLQIGYTQNWIIIYRF